MNILNKILEAKKTEVKILRSDYSYERFRDSAYFDEKGFSFSNAINKGNSIAIISEIKKASPSKGIIKKDFDHISIARIYFSNSADAVSILTDRTFFQGSINFLRDIAEFKSAPLLRKDFIIDEFQVYEAKSNGADAILLICEILSSAQINELTLCAKEIGMDTLLELHSKEEIEKIDFSINSIIGINNRDLGTFSVDINRTKEISPLLPGEVIIVSESGIKGKKDFDLLKENRINAALIGGHLMRAEDLPGAFSQLKEWSRFES